MPKIFEKPELVLVRGRSEPAERLPVQEVGDRIKFIETAARLELFTLQNRGHLVAAFAGQVRQLFPHLAYRALYVSGERLFEDGLLDLGIKVEGSRGLLQAAVEGAGPIPAGSTISFEAGTADLLNFIAPQFVGHWSQDEKGIYGLRSVPVPPEVDLNFRGRINYSVIVAPLKTVVEDTIYGAIVLIHDKETPVLEPFLASWYAAELAIGVRSLRCKGRF